MGEIDRKDSRVGEVPAVSPCIDVVFKALFGKEKNIDLLESLISSVIGLPRSEIQVLQIMNSELVASYRDEKVPRLDLRVKMRSGEDLDIEVQVNPMDMFNERILYYWAKIYSGNLLQGNTYRQLKKCIIINILSFKHFEHDRLHSRFHIHEDEWHEILTDYLEIHYIELPKAKGYNGSKENELLLEWVEFLSIKDGDELVKLREDKEWPEDIVKAFKELEELSKDPEMREAALSREIALLDLLTRLEEAEDRGIEKGKEQGIEQGIEQEKLAVAKRLKEKGIADEVIITATGLSLEAIEKL